MRSVQDKKFGYIFNAWSDGKTKFSNESQTGLTFKAMTQAAKNDKGIAARVQHFVYRSKEELYDYEHDPDALHNLASDPKFANKLKEMRQVMADHMKQSGDPVHVDFEKFLAK